MNKKALIILGCFLLTAIISLFQSTVTGYSITGQALTSNFYRLDRDWFSISLIYPDKFHTPEELTEELYLLNNTIPKLVDLFKIGESIEGRPIYCIRITNEQNPTPKAGALIVAHHHAREQITIEVSLRFLHQLVNNYDINEEVTEYVDSQEIYVIPCLNPDGLHYVLGNETLDSDYWLRKNMHQFDDDGDHEFDEDHIDDANGDGVVSGYDVYEKSGEDLIYLYSYYEGIDDDKDGSVNEDQRGGVDLNRNYAYRWNDSKCTSGSTGDTLNEVYPGTSPFSEPETQAFRNFVQDKAFAMAISLHSGINATYFPWASEDAVWPEPTLYTTIYNDLKDLLPNRFFGEGYLPAQSVRNLPSVSYTSAGTWVDWMYAQQGCVVPMTFEIYKNGSFIDLIEVEDESDTHLIERWDCIYEYFAPSESGKHFNSLWGDITPAFDYWLQNTPRLAVEVKSITGGTTEGDSVKVELNVQNLSPRMSTITSLKVLKENFNSLLKDNSPVTISEIAADVVDEKSFSFNLEESLDSNETINLFIGNDYAGFCKITIQGNQIEKSTPIDFIAIFIAIPSFAALKHSFGQNKRED
ncbi:MAG: M14 family zinc carboxypeptidase [Candidatus Hodarchaeota archaeon]